MNYDRYAQSLMLQRFGPEWEGLTKEQQTAVLADFAVVCLEDYDIPDPTMPDSIAEENMDAAAREYRRRIGGGNLQAYAKCLIVKEDKKNDPAYESEARLRDMEGYGDYEGPRTWP